MKKLNKFIAFVLMSIMGWINVGAYEVVNGIKCEPVWEISRNNGTYDTHFLANNYTYIRTAVIYGDAGNEKVILSWSKPVGDSYYATLVVMNIHTGEIEKEVTLTYGGEPIEGLLCANQIGVDDFGNLWIASYTHNITSEPLKIYVVSDVDDGVCSHRYSLIDDCLIFSKDNHEVGGRIDFCDITGDVTGEKCRASCIAAINTSSKRVVRWQLAKGGYIWENGFDGYTCWDCNEDTPETYPSNQSRWGTVMTYICTNTDDFAGDYFYIDGSQTCVSLYSADITHVEGFHNNPALAPQITPMGVTEFYFKDSVEIYNKYGDFLYYKEATRNFLAYATSDYNSSEVGCQFKIAEFDMDRYHMAFVGLTECWTLPKNGFGTTNANSGMSINSLSTCRIADKQGREGVLLLSYRCGNGVGLYLVADEKFNSDDYVSSVQNIRRSFTEISTQGSSIIISGVAIGDNALIYNTQGVLLHNVKADGENIRIEMPMGGIYIVKCNDTVLKIRL